MVNPHLNRINNYKKNLFSIILRLNFLYLFKVKQKSLFFRYFYWLKVLRMNKNIN